MKRFRKTAVVLLAMLITACALAGCSGSDTSSDSSVDSASESSLEGKTYAFTSYTVDDEDQTETLTEMYSEMTLSFGADGVCTQTITWSEEYAELLGVTDPVEQTGTYEESDNAVTVTFESDEGDTVMDLTIDGDTLSMDEDGCVTTYTAQ